MKELKKIIKEAKESGEADKLEEENKCEWCGADWAKGQLCDEMKHYTNR